jgi:hypothetical protein
MVLFSDLLNARLRPGTYRLAPFWSEAVQTVPASLPGQRCAKTTSARIRASFIEKIGSPGWIRTTDLTVNNRSLYH